MGTLHADFILIGASLSNCLLAWFLKRRHPHCRVVIFEKACAIPGLRTWSFHRADVGECYSEISPLIAQSWPGYDIRLPGTQRTLASEYCTVRPDLLQSQIQNLLGPDLIFSCPVEDIAATGIQLSKGDRWQATCVLDGRNLLQWPGRVGYQKFVGLHLSLQHPHGLQRPVLMDAQVPQSDGYRFFYLLPWSQTELLVEDTRYSANARLDVDLLTTEIENYISQQGWQIQSVHQREKGVLPLPIDAKGFLQAPFNCVGVAGGFFHPVTGYSLPSAVALADRISKLSSLSGADVYAEIADFRAERQTTMKFFCLLNRMMFLAAKPEERYRIFEHFYRMPAERIQRFYSGRLRLDDSMRLLSGKPPVPVAAAVRSILTEGALL